MVEKQDIYDFKLYCELFKWKHFGKALLKIFNKIKFMLLGSLSKKFAHSYVSGRFNSTLHQVSHR